MRKWKCQFYRAYNFCEVLSMKNPNKTWIKRKKNSEHIAGEIITKDLFCFSTNGHIILDDEVSNFKFVYSELHDYEWFEVEEVKEEPKKESYVTKEQIDEYNKKTGKYWNKIRDEKHCQEILSELQKEPIIPEVNHMNKKSVEGFKDSLYSLNNGKTVDIDKELIIDGFNITAHIREEIAKENKTRYVFPNMKAQNQAYTLQVLEKLKEVTEVAEKIKAKHHNKKEEKPTTVETLIDKLDEKNHIDHWSKMLYIAQEGTNKNESLEEFQKRVVPGWKPTKEGHAKYMKEKWATQTLSALGKLQDEHFTDERQSQIDKVRKLLNKKTKKHKQEFDGEKKIYITKDGSDHLYACTDGIVNSAYRLATQSDINKFFKASKKRIKISEKYDKPSNRSFYFKNGVKYYHDLRSGSYYTYGKDNYIKYITEQEYFEGLK